jgi:hypothetical protein
MSTVYKNQVLDESKKHVFDMLLDTVSNMYKVDKDDIFSPRKTRKHVMARAMVVKLMRDTLNLSYRSIAHWMRKERTNVQDLYHRHNKYYCLNTNGYRWDFLDISEEFTGRYHYENTRNAEENRREDVCLHWQH